CVYPLSLHDALPILVRFPLPSWGLSVVQQGPHGGVSAWLASVVVPVAVVEDGGLEVFGAVVFFDAEHEGHHVVIDVEEADVQGGDRKSTRLNSSHVS